MNRQTELALLDWGRRVNAVILSISPPSGSTTPAARREASLKTAFKSIDKRQEELEALSVYLEFADEIIAAEERIA
jgi:hypothetical protein